jgi:hypothetical protein
MRTNPGRVGARQTCRRAGDRRQRPPSRSGENSARPGPPDDATARGRVSNPQSVVASRRAGRCRSVLESTRSRVVIGRGPASSNAPSKPLGPVDRLRMPEHPDTIGSSSTTVGQRAGARDTTRPGTAPGTSAERFGPAQFGMYMASAVRQRSLWTRYEPFRTGGRRGQRGSAPYRRSNSSFVSR